MYMIKKYLNNCSFSALVLSSVLVSFPFGAAHAELDLKLPGYNLPDIGASSVGSISYAKERDIGLKVLREIRATSTVIEDPEITAWVRSLGNRLSARASNSNNPFYFLVVKNNAVNAFATLGGVIVINSGLILKSESEGELAAVLAHEIAHVTQRHISRMIEKSKQNMFGTGAAILAGILASSRSPEAGQAIITGAVAMQAHKDLSFSREAESEADRVGLRILATSGYNPRAMPSFLKKLETEFATGDVNEFLRSHPLTVNRVSEAQATAERYGPYKSRLNSQTYNYMKEKVRVLTRTRGRYGVPAQNATATAKRFFKASSLVQRGNAAAALQLLGQRSSNKSEAILIADALLIQQKYAEVVPLLTPLVRLYPGEDALVIPLANAYLGMRQADKAWALIKRVVISEQTSLMFFEVRQQVARQMGMRGIAYHSVAERNIRLGEYKHAIVQLRQAIKSVDTPVSELPKLQLQLDRIRRDQKKANDEI